MNILGIFSGQSSNERPLRDGASALMVEGKLVCAVPEERVRRVKRAGGWFESSRYCLEASGLSYKDIDIVAYSTCCDSVEDFPPDVLLIEEIFPSASLIRVPHHLSHAIYAFYGSNYERALVIVSDAGGNTLSRGEGDWWKVQREQTTYYLFEGDSYSQIGSDFSNSHEAGFGEVFRATTHYLGWHSSIYSNKTMALSSFGDHEKLGLQPLFYNSEVEERIISRVKNDPLNPIKMLSVVENGLLGKRVKPRTKEGIFEQAHANLAALVQNSYEKALAKRLSFLSLKYNIQNLCLSGGVAYNCQANSRLLDVPELNNIFVPAAPGDTGQAIGNAIWAQSRIDSTQIDRSSINNPYNGKKYLLSSSTFSTLEDIIVLKCLRPTQEIVAELIANGYIVGHFRGSSEFGARALGNRSIFADPRKQDNISLLNIRKRREHFMPFGGSALYKGINDYFSGTRDNPYMQFVLKAKDIALKTLPAIIHIDGTTRLQLVKETSDTAWLAQMLKAFQHLSGIPIVLNTSLNGPGEPIVETPSDAINLIKNEMLDLLIMENFILVKKNLISHIDSILNR
jgi:carbamoyltransferase